jgi:hypothetical protein
MSRSRNKGFKSKLHVCDTFIPKKLTNKTCVKEGAGGHKDVIINTVMGDKVHCAKKYNLYESEFYEKLKIIKGNKNIPTTVINNVFPKFYEYCTFSDSKYFIIENLIGSLGKNVRFVDIKIGYKSSIRNEAGWVKYMRHNIIDKHFSTSGNYGFRMEGTNIDYSKKFKHPSEDEIWDFIMDHKLPWEVDGWNMANSLIKGDMPFSKHSSKQMMILPGRKSARYVIKPLNIFWSFFKSNKEAENLSDKLYYILFNFMLPNFMAAQKFVGSEIHDKPFIIKTKIFKNAIGFVGESLLIATNGKKLNCKLIDFAHAVIINNKSSRKQKELVYEMALNSFLGTVNLIIYLYFYIYLRTGKVTQKSLKTTKLFLKLFKEF